MLLKLVHKVYKTCVSPLFGERCRFYPSCSDYAYQAVEKYGYIKGSCLALKRVCKCRPGHPGGFDELK